MITKAFFTDIENKKVTVLGAERSGLAAARLIKAKGGIPFVSDSGTREKLAARLDELTGLQVNFEMGIHSDRVYDAAFIVVSPGVPEDAPVLKKAYERHIPIISEVEFASGFCKGHILAITGTNGKTTTTSLVEHLLKTAGLRTFAAGNIGNAFSDAVLHDTPDTYYALEVSSFQLDHVEFFKPAVAAILNITPDHMNRYQNSMELYVNAKYRIFKNLDGNDVLILNGDDDWLQAGKINSAANCKRFSLKGLQANGAALADDKLVFTENDKELFSFPTSQLLIRGKHNAANAMAAVLAVMPFISDPEVIARGLRSFPGVEHRLELVKSINGVRYINDSKATNIDSVCVALDSFHDPIYLILGGRDKGNDYEIIKDQVVEKVKKIYAIGESAQKVFGFFHNLIKTEIKNSLEDAVLSANREARDGDIVLLSPACASFDMFNSYEHRGKVFKHAVEDLAR
jgi:UDP-N-acetylmuramoylalanine--D-glutamate ligase